MSFTGLVRIHNIDTYITLTVYNFFLSFSILYPLLVSDQAFISCKTLYFTLTVNAPFPLFVIATELYQQCSIFLTVHASTLGSFI